MSVTFRHPSKYKSKLYPMPGEQIWVQTVEIRGARLKEGSILGFQGRFVPTPAIPHYSLWVCKICWKTVNSLSWKWFSCSSFLLILGTHSLNVNPLTYVYHPYRFCHFRWLSGTRTCKKEGNRFWNWAVWWQSFESSLCSGVLIDVAYTWGFHPSNIGILLCDEGCFDSWSSQCFWYSWRRGCRRTREWTIGL